MCRHGDCMCNHHDYSMSESKDMYICKEKDDCMSKSREYEHVHILLQNIKIYIYARKVSLKEQFL